MIITMTAMTMSPTTYIWLGIQCFDSPPPVGMLFIPWDSKWRLCTCPTYLFHPISPRHSRSPIYCLVCDPYLCYDRYLAFCPNAQISMPWFVNCGRLRQQHRSVMQIWMGLTKLLRSWQLRQHISLSSLTKGKAVLSSSCWILQSFNKL